MEQQLSREQIQIKAKELLNNEVLQIAFADKSNHFVNQMFAQNTNADTLVEIRNKKKGMDEFILAIKGFAEPLPEKNDIQTSI